MPTLSPKISSQPVNFSTNTSSNLQNYNSSLYQSTPRGYPGPGGANSYSTKTTSTSISAPKFWPNNQSMQKTETVKTTYSTGPGGQISSTMTTNYSTNTYKDSQQIPSLANNLDALKVNDTFVKPKIPPSILPKPNLANWQQNQALNKASTTSTTSTQFRQQQSTIPAPGQSSFTGSRPAPRR